MLVHPGGRSEHTRADVAHTGHLEQSLHGAVLTPGAVQQREHDVDLAEHLRHLPRTAYDELAGGAVVGDAHWRE